MSNDDRFGAVIAAADALLKSMATGEHAHTFARHVASSPQANTLLAELDRLRATHTQPGDSSQAEGSEPCWGVYRQRADENEGREFFSYALHHNDDALSEGERRVQGYFVPTDPTHPADSAVGRGLVPLSDRAISRIAFRDHGYVPNTTSSSVFLKGVRWAEQHHIGITPAAAKGQQP